MHSRVKFDAYDELHVELLVHGYCNKFASKDVPVEIIDLCLQFYKIDGGITLLAVGQCGKALNHIFHKNILLDDNNNKAKNDPIVKNSPYFTFNGVPRCLLIDTEPIIGKYGEQSAETRKRLNEESQMFNMNNVITGASGCGNNWAKGYCTEGMELCTEEILPRIREIMEKTAAGGGGNIKNNYNRQNTTIDKQEGFGLIHSIGGGTGSGLGALLLRKIAEEYPKLILYSITVMPHPTTSDVVVEPYNALLTFNAIKDCTDFTFILDNRSLFDMVMKTKDYRMATYEHLNKIGLDMINDVSFMFGKRYINVSKNDNDDDNNNNNSSHVRKKIKGNILNLSRFGAHMVRNPKLKYLTTVHNAISINGKKNDSVVADWDTLKYTSCDVRNGLNLASVFVNYDCGDDKNINNINNNDWSSAISKEFFETNPEKYHFKNKDSVLFVNGVDQDDGGNVSGNNGISMITNNTSVSQCLNRTLTYFGRMYKRKAFLHWYTSEGMEGSEFGEAARYMQSVVQSYNDAEKLYNNGTILKKNDKYNG